MEDLTKELQKLVEPALKEVLSQWLMDEFVTQKKRKLKEVKDINLSQFELDMEGSEIPNKLMIAKMNIAVHAHIHLPRGNWEVKTFGFSMSKKPVLVYNAEKKTYTISNASELNFIELSSF